MGVRFCSHSVTRLTCMFAPKLKQKEGVNVPFLEKRGFTMAIYALFKKNDCNRAFASNRNFFFQEKS